MADEDASGWATIRRELPLNEDRIAFYGRLRGAIQLLEAERTRRGISEAAYDAAQIVDPATREEETEDLARLARSVAALGGRLEVTAVFPDRKLTLLTEPAPPPARDT
jgi:hypothetical protein